MRPDDELQVRPGRIRHQGGKSPKTFVARALAAAEKAGGLSRRTSGANRSAFGRGRAASLNASRGLTSRSRQVVVKARVVRHRPGRAPLSAHLGYLRRDGVSRDGEPGRMFDANGDDVDHGEFAARCEDDRHHFRFIVAPEDASELSDLQAFTRDLMADAERDLGTQLEWAAVAHHNTPHPHVHILVRGRADDGEDLVISRDYIGQGLRARASRLVTLELGPRTEREINQALAKEVEAERFTRLDRGLVAEASKHDSVVDLRPERGGRTNFRRDLQLTRMRKLEQLGVAEPLGPATWRLRSDTEARLRDLGERDDVIARIHKALGDKAIERGPGAYVLDAAEQRSPVLGRLLERGLDDELKGSAYVIIDGVDGRTHHVRLPNIEATGDAASGAIVEARWTQAQEGRRSVLMLSVRSDLDIERQVTAKGATWLDRQLVTREPPELGEAGFGREVSQALGRRGEHLVRQGLARRQGPAVLFAPGLLGKLRAQELDAAAGRIARDSGLPHQPIQEGEMVAGAYRRRVTLASGRFAMIDDGLGFSLVPWRSDLEQHLGRHISGVALPGGGVAWSFDRKRGLGL